jgi:hypothetical protein
VWTGTEMIIWGGNNRTGSLIDGAALNPATGDWRPIAAPPFPLPYPIAVWTGHEMLVTARTRSTTDERAAAYDPATDRWRALPEIPIENDPAAHVRGYITQLAWIDGYAVATVSYVDSRTPIPGTAAPLVLVWSETDNRWFAPTEFNLTRRETIQITAIGQEVLVFVGAPFDQRAAFHYRPATGEVVPFRHPVAQGFDATKGVWTGKHVAYIDRGKVVRLEPMQEKFRLLRPLRPPMSDPSMVWTGKEIILWGGTKLTQRGVKVTANRGIALRVD